MVVDCSVAVAWCFEDEAAADTDAILERVRDEGALASWRIALKPGRPLALGMWRGAWRTACGRMGRGTGRAVNGARRAAHGVRRAWGATQGAWGVACGMQCTRHDVRHVCC